MKKGLINVIKYLLAAFLYYSGIAAICRFIFNRLHKNPVTILCIHKVIDGSNGESNLAKLYLKMGHLEFSDFKRRLIFLKNKFNIISFDEYLAAGEDRRPLAPNSCILTFDDGDLEHYTKVYPLLKKLKIPATFFIPTGYISNNNCKWDDEITALLVDTKIKEFEFHIPLLTRRVFKIGTIDEKAEVANYLCRTLKYASSETRKIFIKRSSKRLQIMKNYKVAICQRSMGWHHLKNIANDSLMSIGAHTQTHPVLTILKDNEIKDELSGSKREIEENIEKLVTLFSYSFGKLTDFDERIKEIAKEV